MFPNLIIIYVIVCVALMYIMMMGPTRYHRDGLVGKANRMLHRAPALIGQLFCIVVSGCSRETGRRRWAAVEHRLVRRKNPSVMIFYLIVVGGAATLYARYVVAALSSQLNQAFSASVIALSALSYIVCCRSDPGVVRADTISNPQNKRFAFDGFMYNATSGGAGAACTTCKTPKPARSKHCSLCGHCVRRFDHHCAWINNDVGENNHRYFLLFLYVHAILCFVAACDSLVVLNDFIDEHRLWEASFYDRATGNRSPATMRVVVLYCLFHRPWVSAIFLFGLVVGFVLVGFLVYQLRMVFRGVTANELNKIEDAQDFIENVCSFDQHVAEWVPSRPTEHPPELAAYVAEPPFMSSECIGKLIALARLPDITLKDKRERAATLMKEFYGNHGSWYVNTMEVLFPYSTHYRQIGRAHV